MHKLLMMLNGSTRLMEEAGGEGGGGGEPTNALATAASEGEGGDAGDGTGGEGGGGEPTNALATAAKEGTEPSEPTKTSEPSKPAEGGEETAEDIEKFITEADNDFKGKWDSEQLKEMAPLLKECGVSKENASKLAVKLAEVQTKQIAAYEAKMRQEQMERIKAQDAKNAEVFSKADYSQIVAGMNKFAKEGGALRTLLTTTELGTDPEVLKILHTLGGLSAKETGAPAASGAMRDTTGWAEAFEK
jgi:hypothetical protein